MKNILKSLNAQTRREFYIKKNYPELHKNINNFSAKVNYESYSELLFKYYNNIIEDINCKMCENEVKFKGFNFGYVKYCSKKCIMSDKEIIDKRAKKSIKTNLEKYGVNNYAKTEECKNKVRKTNLEKYGKEYYTQTEKYKNDIINKNLEKYGKKYYLQTKEFKNKSRETNLEKYGVDHHTKSIDFKKGRKINNLEKYDKEHYVQTEEFKNKSRETNLEKYGVDHHMTYKSNNNLFEENNRIKNIEYYSNYDENIKLIGINNFNILEFEGKKCEHIFEINKQLLYLRKKRNMNICTICNSTKSNNTSHYELELQKFLSLLDIKFLKNSKKIISPYEIDIFIPELNIAFEFNGLYWHSELFKDKNYHLDKTEICENREIQLMHIWEDDWLYKQDIVKSMILNKLGKTPNKIYARKTEIKEITDTKLISKFLDENHLQGKCQSSINIGLYYSNKLVSLMTFGKLRRNLGYTKSTINNNSFELIRFCNILNTSVVGGASKLFKYFIKNYNFTKIITYSKNDHSVGNLYKQLKFEYYSNTVCGYSYIGNDKIRENRYNYTKHKLVELGYDSNKTEREIMLERGYYRIYDCGNKKWIFNNSFN